MELALKQGGVRLQGEGRLLKNSDIEQGRDAGRVHEGLVGNLIFHFGCRTSFEYMLFASHERVGNLDTEISTTFRYNCILMDKGISSL